MKYRGEQPNTYNMNGVSYYQQHHNHRFNGPVHSQTTKPNRTYVPMESAVSNSNVHQHGNVASGQGQIELVEKILNQISMHQSSSSCPANTKIRGAGSGPIRGGRSSFHKKVPHQYNNSHGRFKNKFATSNVNVPLYGGNGSKGHKDRSFIATNVNMQQCSRIEPMNNSSESNEQCSLCEYMFVDGQLLPKVICTHKNVGSNSIKNSTSYNRSRSEFSNRSHTKTAVPKAFVNRSKKCNNINPHHNTYQQKYSYSAVLSPFKEADISSQSIISKRNLVGIKKFIEAEIIFDQNIIEVIPLHVNSVDNNSSIENDKVEIYQADNDVKFSSNVSKQLHETIDHKEDEMIKPTQPVHFVQPNEVKALGLIVSGNMHSQTVKKIRCLIANFITIHIEDGGADCDILQAVDREKLGFQNFDGKNIGLYKNIGYINRNKNKFARPTQDLLQLLLLPREIGVSNSVTDNVGDNQPKAKLDLSPFYDRLSYDKEYAYSVLESLINDDSHLTSHIKARKYRYPDCDYSSECDEFQSATEPYHTQLDVNELNVSERRRRRRHRRSLSNSDKSLRWFESDNECNTFGGNSGSHFRGGKFNTTRYINNSTFFNDKQRTNSLIGNEQYGSFYITEISFTFD